jgi:hypothetical protein
MWSLQKHGHILGIAMCNKTRAPLHQLTAVTIDYSKQCLYNHHPLMTPKLHVLTSGETVQEELTTCFKMNRLTCYSHPWVERVVGGLLV